jgi:hypothetical protein
MKISNVIPFLFRLKLGNTLNLKLDVTIFKIELLNTHINHFTQLLNTSWFFKWHHINTSLLLFCNFECDLTSLSVL